MFCRLNFPINVNLEIEGEVFYEITALKIPKIKLAERTSSYSSVEVYFGGMCITFVRV